MLDTDSKKNCLCFVGKFQINKLLKRTPPYIKTSTIQLIECPKAVEVYFIDFQSKIYFISIETNSIESFLNAVTVFLYYQYFQIDCYFFMVVSKFFVY